MSTKRGTSAQSSYGLAAIFVAALPASARASARGLRELDAELRRLLHEASAAWPQLSLPAEVFLPYLAARTEPSSGGAGLDLEHTHAPELYLACACSRGSTPAIAAFEAHYLSEVGRALRRMDVTTSFIEEMQQSIRCRLLVARNDGQGDGPGILDYRGRGSLRGWVRSVAVHATLNLLQRDKVARRRGGEDEILNLQALGDDPELAHLKGLYAGKVKEALAEAMASLSQRQRTLLRQHLVDGLSIDDLGALYRVHRATAARWLAEARTSLAAATRRSLVARLRVGDSQAESIMRLVRSRLDLSVHRFFDDSPTLP